MKKLFMAFVTCLIVTTGAQAQIISTFAGNGVQGNIGDNGPATSVELGAPYAVAADKHGNVYFTDNANNNVRKVDTSGIITTIAGNGSVFHSGDGGPATAAGTPTPRGIAIDTAGNIYLAFDGGDSRIRKINTSGIITTIAGTATFGFGGDNGPATLAQIQPVEGIAVDLSGNVYIADIGNNRIRKINTSGIITTIAGNGTPGYSGYGGPATAAELNGPLGIAVDDTHGNLFIADYGNNRIEKLNLSTGIITTVAGDGTSGSLVLTGDGGPATGTQIWDPIAVAISSNGNLLYIAIAGTLGLRKVDTSGIITTVAGNGHYGYAGDGGPATMAMIVPPYGVAIDFRGNIYFSQPDWFMVRKVNDTSYVPMVSLSVTDKKVQSVIAKIYPNPVVDEINVQMPGEFFVTLLNMASQNVAEQKGYDHMKINMENLPAGVYIINISNDVGNVTQKILKN